MSQIIDLIINGISRTWEIMQNFEFLGTNMLTFSITILIITAMLPILLTLVSNVNTNARASYKEKQRAERRERKSDK